MSAIHQLAISALNRARSAQVSRDTHIFIICLCGKSRTSLVHDLLALGRAGSCEITTSGYAVEEARRNLEAKGPIGSTDDFAAALAGITPVAEARGAARAAAEAAALTDPADVPILAAAIQCRADLLVTGDCRAFGRDFRTRVSGVEVLVLRDALRRVVGLPLE